MSRRRQDTVTFKGVLEVTAPGNKRRLMQRARTANRLAKSVSGKARRVAYRVKTDALVNLKKCFPNEVQIKNDFRQPGMVVIAVPASRFGLHAPSHNFVVGEGIR